MTDRVNSEPPNVDGCGVLVVDDNPDLLRILGRFLAGHGLRVDLAANGLAGLHLLDAHPEKYDLVLLDIHMPEPSGYEVLRQIRRSAHPGVQALPVLAMSGDEERAEAAGFDKLLKKPFAFDELIPAIARALARHQTRQGAQNAFPGSTPSKTVSELKGPP